jgi:hypothetical protein
MAVRKRWRVSGNPSDTGREEGMEARMHRIRKDSAKPIEQNHQVTFQNAEGWRGNEEGGDAGIPSELFGTVTASHQLAKHALKVRLTKSLLILLELLVNAAMNPWARFFFVFFVCPLQHHPVCPLRQIVLHYDVKQ